MQEYGGREGAREREGGPGGQVRHTCNSLAPEIACRAMNADG
jgi:hypothetical protein